MKTIITILILLPVFSFSQKLSPYKYGEVDTVLQYVDAQIISYKDKNQKQKRDTIWATQKKRIEIEFAHLVSNSDIYLKPRIKFNK